MCEFIGGIMYVFDLFNTSSQTTMYKRHKSYTSDDTRAPVHTGTYDYVGGYNFVSYRIKLTDMCSLINLFIITKQLYPSAFLGSTLFVFDLFGIVSFFAHYIRVIRLNACLVRKKRVQNDQTLIFAQTPM